MTSPQSSSLHLHRWPITLLVMHQWNINKGIQNNGNIMVYSLIGSHIGYSEQ